MPRIRHILRWLTGLGLAALFLTGTAWFGLHLLYEANYAGCDCESDPYDWMRVQVSNPFRDKRPEWIADAAIRKLDEPNCGGLKIRADECQNAQRYKSVSWRLTGRDNEKAGSELRFWVVTDQHSFGHPLWMFLAHEGGSWTITDIDTFY